MSANYSCPHLEPSILSASCLILDIQLRDKDVKRKNITRLKGEGIDETCNVIGYPTVTYNWFGPDKNEVLRSKKQLVFGNLNSTDFGTYKCIAKNHAGSITYTLQLREETGKVFHNSLFLCSVKLLTNKEGVAPPGEWDGVRGLLRSPESYVFVHYP